VSWSESPHDRADGPSRRANRGRRGPRWVTDHAQDVVRRLPPPRRGDPRWTSHEQPPQRQSPPPPRRQQPPEPPPRRREPPEPSPPGWRRRHSEPYSERWSQEEERYPWDADPDYEPRRDDHGRASERRTRSYETPEPTAEPQDTPSESEGRPRKLTVTRVAAWRGRQLTKQGIRAFRRATTADGADRSGLTGLTYPVMLSFGADAAVAVALANTFFFSAATAESKTKVALYLLVTVAPFALLAPVIGPLLDRLQRGRRMAMAVSFVGRALLAVVMAQHFDDWLLYPAALGSMVLARSFGVLKAAVTPRVLPPDITLTKTNSRLAVFGLAAGGVLGAVAAGFAWLFDSPGALLFTAVLCGFAALLCIRLPAWVEVTEGEVPASLVSHEESGASSRRQPMGRHVVVALWGNGTIRILTGFLALFVAFVIKAQTEHSPWRQLVLLGLVGAAAGIGNITGNALGARQHFDKPDQVILTCVGIVLGSAVLAALVQGIGTAVVVGLVGSTCSSLAKVCHDAVVQRDMPEESRASAFGRTETILQLAWTFGGAIGVLMPPIYWLGFTVVAVLVGLGTLQTALAHRGSSLIPRLGGDRPVRPDPESRRRTPRPARAPAEGTWQEQ
jgi:Major Facilitator Superfamily